MNPDPNCIFMTPTHREAFSVLLYSISRKKGFVVLTGDAGTGKTTLLRALMRSTTDAVFSVVFSPSLKADEFLELALLDFGVSEIPDSKSQRIVRFREFLFDLRIQGKSPVLIVDEAHMLKPETLEEIRLLTNFETSKEKLLQVVLAGQNDLAVLLNRPDLRQLKQRIEIRVSLKALEPGEVGGYIQYRWSHAGGTEPAPFSQEATALITRASKGIPRLVNSICDNVLLLCYAGGERQVGVGHVYQVLRDLDLSDVPTPVRSAGKRLRLSDLERPAGQWAVRRDELEGEDPSPFKRASNE